MVLSDCRIATPPKGGLGITPQPALGMTVFYSLTAHLVSWLGSLPHAS
jgi:hypothetical protein